MKTDKYYEKIEWENPWKVFKKGILPIGLAIAYREKHGYDPLKACRLCLWLDHVQGFIWWWSITVIIGASLYTPLINKSGVDLLKHILQVPLFSCSIMFTIVLLLIFIFTRKTYKQSRRRMLDFRNSTYSFVSAFNSMFEDESSAINGSMGKDELLVEVSRDMTRTAQAIVEGEIIGHEKKNERYQLGKKSTIANTFGLGSEWSVYFKEARSNINAYELFAWEI